jgi:hypothetical protein
MCQSVAAPSRAEYWHIGAMTMRFASSSEPSFSGVKRWAIGRLSWWTLRTI